MSVVSMDSKLKDLIGGCCVCADESGWEENPLVYCDGPGCYVAVHQGENHLFWSILSFFEHKKPNTFEDISRVKKRHSTEKINTLPFQLEVSLQ